MCKANCILCLKNYLQNVLITFYEIHSCMLCQIFLINRVQGILSKLVYYIIGTVDKIRIYINIYVYHHNTLKHVCSLNKLDEML